MSGASISFALARSFPPRSMSAGGRVFEFPLQVMVFYATILNCDRFIISGGKDDGIARACRWFRSDRHHATRWHLDPCHGERPRLQPAKTNGIVAQTATRLGSWVRKKIDDLSCSAAPVVGRKEKRPPHLLKNGPKAGYFDYAAFGKYNAGKAATCGACASRHPPSTRRRWQIPWRR